MPRIKLLIEYDGTDYVGWQFQDNGLSIQQVMEQALEKILGETVRLHSSGRTDAGVHARGMVAHFDTTKSISLKAYIDGVNGLLPPDIAVREACDADPDFFARFDASGKWYRYSIYSSAVRSPVEARYSWHLKKTLDLHLMKQAAALLVGTHDFGAFRSSRCSARGAVRQIYSIELLQEGAMIHLDIRGSGFLRNMVRIIAGTLAEVGLGKRSVESIEELLQGRDRQLGGRTAPASGLCLMEVYYDPSAREARKARQGEKALDRAG